MLLAVAALLLQPLAVPQNLLAPVKALAASAGADSPSVAGESPLVLPEFAVSGVAFEPGRTVAEPVPANPIVTVIVVPVPPDTAEPAAAAVVANPAAAAEIAAIRPRVTLERTTQQRRAWLTLSVAQHGAASFDAWSTRRAISSGAGRELNPMLRPFAGNASLYAAIQVGPLALDYVGRRMMTSRHPWLRHTWWLPQTLGTAMSFASGVDNLSVRPGR